MTRLLHSVSVWLPLAATLALAACGGGSSDSPATPPAQGLTLSGTAATGAALAGATVEAKCNGSIGSTTTLANGSYSLVLSSGSLPCVLRATPAGGAGDVLHSLAQGGTTAHITPVSHLIVSSLAGDAPASYYGAFDATVAGALTAASVQEAKARVVALLKSGGTNFSSFGDVLTAPLVVGNAFDQALDALAQRLAAQSLTLSALTDAVQRASPANTTPKPGTVSLPPEALLQPASATCSALRSGLNRVVMLKASNAGEYSTSTVNFDVVASTFATTNVGGSFNGQFTSTGACSYSLSNGGEMVVSQAGLVVMRTLEDGTSGAMRMVIAFPEQAHTVAELGGTWSTLGFSPDDVTHFAHADAASVVHAADGTWGSTSYCPAVLTCAAVNTQGFTDRVNASGGFDFVNTINPADSGGRKFLYRAGNGSLLLVSLDSNGGFSVWAPQRTNTLPTVGAHTLSWGVVNNPRLVASTVVSTSDFDVTETHPDSMSYLRTSRIDGHLETLSLNTPRDGYGFRAEGTAATTGGTTVAVREFTSLGLPGMGVSALSLPTLTNGTGVPNGVFFLSVNQP